MVNVRQNQGLFLGLLLVLFSILCVGQTHAEEEATTADPTEQAADEAQAEPEPGEQGADEQASVEKKETAAKDPFEEVMALNQKGSAKEEGQAEAPSVEGEEGATATLPIHVFSALARRERVLQEQTTQAAVTPVVLGSALYEGEVLRGVLSVHMKLLVTLSGDGLKFVPLVGDEASLVSASTEGESIGVTRRPGYHVWVTRRTGVVSLDLAFLVRPHGGRGSLEYTFHVARTPSTRAAVYLPQEGLSPRFDGAIQNIVGRERGGTKVQAMLIPTTEIRMVGFRDMGAEEQQTTRAAVETLSLLSVDESAVELFSVLRYTILRGSMQAFDVVIPEGLEVVSAAGEGAFHYALEHKDGMTLFRGETALPIEGSYELSLRLRERLATHVGASSALALTMPHCLGTEREHGWLAVEVPGKLRISETSRVDLIGVSVPELPLEARANAISPVLHAYRYHEGRPSITFSVERLPEQDLEEGAIDAIVATSVLASEGKLVTEMRISLRNASRPSLVLTLPAATELQKAWLDGEPVFPSRDEMGRLLLPLARSGQGEENEVMLLEVVLESTVSPLGFFGEQRFALPALDLGATSLVWKLRLPSSYRYGDPRARLAPEMYWGSLSWFKPPHLKHAVRWNEDGQDEKKKANSRASSLGELLTTGTEIELKRYWLSASEPPTLRVPFLRQTLVLPFQMVLGLVALALGLVFARRYLVVRDREPTLLFRGYLERIPRRLLAYYRRQVFTRRRAARAILLGTSSLVVLWFLAVPLLKIVKIVYALVVGEA